MSDKNFVVKNGLVVGTTATISGIEIDPSGATSDQILKFNGTKFVSANQSGSITVSSSAPASPTEGALWFDSDTAQTFIYYDSQWIEIGGAGSGAKMFVGVNAPSSPAEGTLWFNSTTAQTFIYYDSQWVEIGDIINGSQAINDLNDVAITSAAANQLLSYNGSAWVNTSSPTIPGNLTVSGNVSVSGTQIDTSSSQANDVLKFDGTKYSPSPEGIFNDNILLINNASSATPSYNAGIEVERGSFNNVLIRWNESTDVWEFTNDGSTYRELSKTNAVVAASAPASPYEGQIWFDSSEGGTYIYYGSTWIEVGAAPVDTLLATINAKGDILVGTADNTVNRLAVGSNGQLLAANSSTSTGLEWQTPTYASTGKAIAMAIVFGG